MTRLKNIYLATLPVLLATLLLGAIAYGLLPHVGTNARLLRIVFIGLAVLTVPHMFLDTLAQTGKDRLTDGVSLYLNPEPPSANSTPHFKFAIGQ